MAANGSPGSVIFEILRALMSDAHPSGACVRARRAAPGGNTGERIVLPPLGQPPSCDRLPVVPVPGLRFAALTSRRATG